MKLDQLDFSSTFSGNYVSLDFAFWLQSYAAIKAVLTPFSDLIWPEFDNKNREVVNQLQILPRTNLLTNKNRCLTAIFL